ncbi:MAG: hypothetical protein J2P41_14630, partial [Blastocatellia bacterium]|nr:hypothetical protein [Blastocatellia bacterium]
MVRIYNGFFMGSKKGQNGAKQQKTSFVPFPPFALFVSLKKEANKISGMISLKKWTSKEMKENIPIGTAFT